MARSPEALTAEHLRSLGYDVDKVTYFNTFSRRTVDLYGIADLIAANDEVTVLVQATSRSNLSARRQKILASEIAKRWLARPDRRIWLYAWGRTATAGDYKFVDIRLADFEGEAA